MKPINKIKERKKVGAICLKCKSPDYKYVGRVSEPNGKHEFQCNSCGSYWQYGTKESIYTELA